MSLQEFQYKQVMTSQSSAFHGDMEGRELTTMSFGDFLALSASDTSYGQHYLAQVPIWSSMSAQDVPLRGLLPHIKLPSFLNPQNSSTLQAINFWMASR